MANPYANWLQRLDLIRRVQSKELLEHTKKVFCESKVPRLAIVSIPCALCGSTALFAKEPSVPISLQTADQFIREFEAILGKVVCYPCRSNKYHDTVALLEHVETEAALCGPDCKCQQIEYPFVHCACLRHEWWTKNRTVCLTRYTQFTKQFLELLRLPRCDWWCRGEADTTVKNDALRVHLESVDKEDYSDMPPLEDVSHSSKDKGSPSQDEANQEDDGSHPAIDHKVHVHSDRDPDASLVFLIPTRGPGTCVGHSLTDSRGRHTVSRTLGTVVELYPFTHGRVELNLTDSRGHASFGHRDATGSMTPFQKIITSFFGGLPPPMYRVEPHRTLNISSVPQPLSVPAPVIMLPPPVVPSFDFDYDPDDWPPFKERKLHPDAVRAFMESEVVKWEDVVAVEEQTPPVIPSVDTQTRVEEMD